MFCRKFVLFGTAVLAVVVAFVQADYANAQSSNSRLQCTQKCQAQRQKCLSFPDVYIAVCDRLHNECMQKCGQ